MRKLYAKLIGGGVAFLAIAAPMFARAQGIVSCGQGTGRFCQFCDIFLTIHNVFTFFVLQVTVPLATLMFIVGGLILMFGGGSPSLLTKAKSILKFTLIGVLVVLLSWIIVNSLITILIGDDNLNTTGKGPSWPWHTPVCTTGSAISQCIYDCIEMGKMGCQKECGV